MSNRRRMWESFRYEFFMYSPAGVRGLMNFGLTCCVNALLQSFSATCELLDLLHDWKPLGANRDSGNVPAQLKRALEAMKNEPSRPAPHSDFLRCLDLNYIRCNIQHDADEVFLCILNLVQQQMDDKALALDVLRLYQIPVEMQVQCLDCTLIQSRDSYLVNLPLSIRQGSCSLEECMADFFEPQELRGVDSCHCARCEDKTPSTQCFKLLSLPPVLCVLLKRFNNRRGATRKLDNSVSFPERFDVRETLAPAAFSRAFAEGDCRYTLYAVVVHSGSAFCGHYTAYVRHRGGDSWYYADDGHVRQVTWSDVRSSYGGGHRGTAYMLLYRRGREEGEPRARTDAHTHESSPAVPAEEPNGRS